MYTVYGVGVYCNCTGLLLLTIYVPLIVQVYSLLPNIHCTGLLLTTLHCTGLLYRYLGTTLDCTGLLFTTLDCTGFYYLILYWFTPY